MKSVTQMFLTFQPIYLTAATYIEEEGRVLVCGGSESNKYLDFTINN